jgi:predicted nucleic acid-binding protein
LAWLRQQQCCAISVISWIEVLVGCLEGESERVQPWLKGFQRLELTHEIAAEAVRCRRRQGLKAPAAILLATARCHRLTLATRNSRDFPADLEAVLHPYRLEPG